MPRNCKACVYGVVLTGFFCFFLGGEVVSTLNKVGC